MSLELKHPILAGDGAPSAVPSTDAFLNEVKNNGGVQHLAGKEAQKTDESQQQSSQHLTMAVIPLTTASLQQQQPSPTSRSCCRTWTLTIKVVLLYFAVSLLQGLPAVLIMVASCFVSDRYYSEQGHIGAWNELSSATQWGIVCWRTFLVIPLGYSSFMHLFYRSFAINVMSGRMITISIITTLVVMLSQVILMLTGVYNEAAILRSVGSYAVLIILILVWSEELWRKSQPQKGATKCAMVAAFALPLALVMAALALFAGAVYPLYLAASSDIEQQLMASLFIPLLTVSLNIAGRAALQMSLPITARAWMLCFLIQVVMIGSQRLLIGGLPTLPGQATAAAISAGIELIARSTVALRDRTGYNLFCCWKRTLKQEGPAVRHLRAQYVLISMLTEYFCIFASNTVVLLVRLYSLDNPVTLEEALERFFSAVGIQLAFEVLTDIICLLSEELLGLPLLDNYYVILDWSSQLTWCHGLIAGMISYSPIVYPVVREQLS